MTLPWDPRLASEAAACRPPGAGGGHDGRLGHEAKDTGKLGNRIRETRTQER
jgi:hypothetical protein